MNSGLSDSYAPSQTSSSSNAITDQPIIQGSDTQDNNSTGSTFSNRDVCGCEGKNCVGCFCTDDQATRDEYWNDYWCCSIGLRFGKPTPEDYYQNLYQPPVYMYEKGERDEMERDIKSLELSPHKEAQDRAKKLKDELTRFEPKTPKPPRHAESDAFSGLVTMMNVGTGGQIPAAKEAPKKSSPIIDDPMKEMRERDYQRKVEIGKNQNGMLGAVVTTVLPAVMPSIHSSGGPPAGHGSSRGAGVGTFIDSADAVTGVAVDNLYGRKKKSDDGDKPHSKDAKDNHSHSRKKKSSTNYAMKTVRTVFS